jgi:hypothetical protein
MSIDLNFYKGGATALIGKNNTLVELSSIVSYMIDDYLGRGVYRFDFLRGIKNGDCVLESNALCDWKPLVFSSVTPLSRAVKEGVVPRNLSEEEIFQNDKTNLDSALGPYESIIDSHLEHQNLPLALISYGLSDLVTGLFALGVRYVKWQGSGLRTQIYVKSKLTEDEIMSYLKTPVDYDVNALVKTLK